MSANPDRVYVPQWNPVRGNYTSNISYQGLPNFVTSELKSPQAPAQFSYAVKCQNVSFTGMLPGNNCSATTYPALSSTWLFGDPASGNNNTSTAGNPTHYYQALGTYTVKLIVNYQCSADTVIQQVTVSNAGPTFSLTGKTNICKNQTSTLTTAGTVTTAGTISYTWASTNVVSASVSVSPTVTTVYSVAGTDANGCTAINTIQVIVNRVHSKSRTPFRVDETI